MKVVLIFTAMLISNMAQSAVYGVQYNSEELISYSDLKSNKTKSCSGIIRNVTFKKVGKTSTLATLIDQSSESVEVVIVNFEKVKTLNVCSGLVFTQESKSFAMGLSSSIGKKLETYCVEKSFINDQEVVQICEFVIK